MDAIAFIWKILLTKVSIKTLTLSMSFDCFLSGFSRLYGKPAQRDLSSTADPLGWKELLSMALWPQYGPPLSLGRITNPDSSSQTDSGSTNLSWMEWLHFLDFQLQPSLQSLFFPWLCSWKFFIQHPHLSKLLQKEQVTWNCWKAMRTSFSQRKSWRVELSDLVCIKNSNSTVLGRLLW